MKLSDRGEQALLDALKKSSAAAGPNTAIAIGDDAAAVKNHRGGYLLLSTDLMCEGVHFDLSYCLPAQAGFKLVASNVSDIYAMGGEPESLLFSLSAGPETDVKVIDGLFEGINEACRLFGAELVGGDVSGSKSGMFLNAAITGRCKKPVQRSTAREGDYLYVSGPLGRSALGLWMLKKCLKRPVALKVGEKGISIAKAARLLGLGVDEALPHLKRHLVPLPAMLPRQARSAMDISDGLSMDVWRLLRQSGVGGELWLEALPLLKETSSAARKLGLDPLVLALDGGEEYEMLYTARGSAPGVKIGRVVDRSRGLGIRNADGKLIRLKPGGYEHFR